MAGLIDFGILQPGNANALMTGYNQATDRRNALKQTDMQNQLATMQLQGAQRTQQQADAEEQAWRDSAGDPAKAYQNLMGAGLGKQATALQTQIQQQQAAKLARMKDVTSLMKTTATSIMSNPAIAQQALQQFGQATGTDVSNDLATLASFNGDPAAIKNWAAAHALEADKLLPKFQQFDNGSAVVMGAVDPLTGTFTQNGAVKKTMTPGEAARLPLEERRTAATERGAATSAGNLDIARQTLDLKRQGQVELPTKEIQRRESKYPVATAALKESIAANDKLVKDLELLRDHPGLNGITGVVYGRTPSVTPEAREAQAKFDKIMARGGFQELAKMRAASPTGGALGNVSDTEGKYLRAAFAAMDRTQSKESFQKAVNDAIEELKGSNGRIQDAYDLTYEYKAPKAATPAAPASGTHPDFPGFSIVPGAK